MTIVPSQVVNYLESRFGSFAEGRGLLQLHQPYRATVGAALALIDRIPSHLLSFSAEENAEFLEALEAMRGAIAVWDAGPTPHLLKAPENDRQKHPVFVVYRLLESLPDEAALPEMANRLVILGDAKLAASLAADIAAANQALDHGEWKAATVLAGSITEALLLWAVERLRADDRGAFENVVAGLSNGSSRYRGQPENWSLAQLIRVANRGGRIREETTKQCGIAKDFRNLIHPGRAKRLAADCDRGTALSSVAAIEHVLRDLQDEAS